MAIENEDLFDGKKISDILKEYYHNLKDDRNEVSSLIKDLKINKPLISPFEAEGRARLISVLLDNKQKTTNGLINIANAAARLQGNQSKKKDDATGDIFSEALKMIEARKELQQLESGKDEVEDLVKQMEQLNETARLISDAEDN
jgi:hypothetical protein